MGRAERSPTRLFAGFEGHGPTRQLVARESHDMHHSADVVRSEGKCAVRRGGQEPRFNGCAVAAWVLLVVLVPPAGSDGRTVAAARDWNCSHSRARRVHLRGPGRREASCALAGRFAEDGAARSGAAKTA